MSVTNKRFSLTRTADAEGRDTKTSLSQPLPQAFAVARLLFWTVQFGFAATLTHTNGTIRFAGSDFALSFSDTNGSLLSVGSNGQAGTVFGRAYLLLGLLPAGALPGQASAWIPGRASRKPWAARSAWSRRITALTSAGTR
jgi:hypothetical protein